MNVETVTATMVATTVTSTAFHPLDTILTLQQTSTNFSYKLPFLHYWRGLGAQLVLASPGAVVYMVAYRQSKADLAPILGVNSLTNYAASATISEIFANVLWTPMEIIKGRLQIASGSGLGKTSHVIRDIYASEGWRGFFRGYWVSLAVYLPHSVVWWMTYEEVKKLMYSSSSSSSSSSREKRELSTLDYLIASGAGSAAANTCTNMLQVIQSRQQLATAVEVRNLRPTDQLNLFQLCRNLIKEVGLVRALFKGLHVRLAVTVPAAAVNMAILESLSPDVPFDTDAEAVDDRSH